MSYFHRINARMVFKKSICAQPLPAPHPSRAILTGSPVNLPFNNNKLSFARRAKALSLKAFTLVELLVVIAIISVLAAVALPAYNNYSTKSKFSEVVLATAPTKAFVSTCAIDGDCASGNTIILSVASSAPASGSASAALAPPMNVFASTIVTGCAGNFSPSQIASFVTAWSTSYTVSVDPAHNGNYCMMLNGGSSCADICGAKAGFTGGMDGIYVTSLPAATFGAAYVATPTGSSAAMSVPCVGGSGCSPATKYVATVSNDSAGVVTATAQSTSGLNAETFVLIPQLSGGRVDWSVSGTCKTRAGGALC